MVCPADLPVASAAGLPGKYTGTCGKLRIDTP